MTLRKGLPGLRPIRERLELSQAKLGSMCGKKGRSEDFIRHLETGFRDCSQTVQRELSEALCCTVSDLHGQPSETTLKKIFKDFHMRIALAGGSSTADALAGGQGAA